MRFEYTPQELQPLAELVANEFQSRGYRIRVERALEEDSPLCTTVLASKGHESVLLEIQTKAVVSSALVKLATWLNHERKFACVYIAMPSDHEIPGGVVRDLKRYGIGLLLVEDDGRVHEVQRAQTYALLVPQTPPVPLGKKKVAVVSMCRRFNDGDRKDALRDLFELVEGETDKLAKKAASKEWITKSEEHVASRDWSTKINYLASSSLTAQSKPVLINSKLKDDLHSFRGARNLLDHAASGVRAANKRQLQFQERMIQGPRLLSELLTLQRKVR